MRSLVPRRGDSEPYEAVRACCSVGQLTIICAIWAPQSGGSLLYSDRGVRARVA